MVVIYATAELVEFIRWGQKEAARQAERVRLEMMELKVTLSGLSAS